MKIKLFTSKKISPSSIGNGNPQSAVLFVHGIGGSYWTWNKFSLHLEKNWEEVDSFGLEYDEYYVNQGWMYKTPVLSFLQKIWKILRGPDLQKLSQHLGTVINEVCHEYENVIIIAHSMGGLVARKYIVDILKETKSTGKVKALITYATPHQGSVLANYYLILCYYFLGSFIKNSMQVTQLSKGNDFISTLNKMWSDLRVEDKIDFERVVGFDDWVVDVNSAAYNWDSNVRAIANKNHFTIIKPVQKKDPAFMVTYNYLKHFKNNLEMKAENEEDYNLDKESNYFNEYEDE